MGLAPRRRRSYPPTMKACRTCGQSNPDDAEYCASCGSPLAADTGPREERKVVTILFCDLVEFTSRFDQADPEDVRETLATYQRAFAARSSASGARSRSSSATR